MRPNEIRLDDGFSSVITFSNMPTVKFFEKEITPPGYSAGGAIDTTTMRNLAYRTSSPKKLKSLKNVAATVAYATDSLRLVWEQMGKNQQITVTFPDQSTITFWGWLDEFTPSQLAEGAQPTAALVIVCGNVDNNGVETAPQYAASGDSGNS